MIYLIEVPLISAAQIWGKDSMSVEFTGNIVYGWLKEGYILMNKDSWFFQAE